MKTTRSTEHAFTLIEMLVYLGVLVVILSVGYAALYRCMDTSRALRRSSGHIVDALHAGENWRADVRAGGGNVQFQSKDDEQILRLTGARGEVSYRFASNTIFRRLGNKEWSQVLGNVKSSAFVSESRHNITAWRWELELQGHAKNLSHIPPLFTFSAVPGGEMFK